MKNISENNHPHLVPQKHQGKLATVREVLRAIEGYFEQCDEREASYTIPGLCYFLGVADTRLLFGTGDYGGVMRKSPESAQTVKLFSSPDIQQSLRLAKIKIEAQRANQLLDSDKNTSAIIFDLKATFGWQDKQSISVENPDGNLGSKYAVVLPAVPGQLSMAEWQKAYDEMMALRKQEALSDY